jgi:hypothetical protein
LLTEDLANERQLLKQRDIEGALPWRAILDREGVSQDAVSRDIFGIADELIAVRTSGEV